MKIFGPEARGSVGAVTTSRNTFALYQRARVGRGGTPIVSIGAAVAAWQSLSFDQQKAWVSWAAQLSERNSLGIERRATGVERFTSAFLYSQWLGLTTPTDPPAEIRPLLVVSSLTLSAVGLLVTYTAAVSGPGLPSGFLEVSKVDPPSTLGTQSPPGRGRHWTFGGATAVVGGAVQISTLVASASGRVFVRARCVGSDYRASPWVVAAPIDV